MMDGFDTWYQNYVISVYFNIHAPSDEIHLITC